MTDKLKWIQWNGSDILRCEKTHHHTAWVQPVHDDNGYRIDLWNDDIKDWESIAHAPDLDAAKMIAKLHVEGELV